MIDHETICLLRNGNGLDLASYVQRVFRDAETARRWRNRQSRNVRIAYVAGRHKVGDRIDLQASTRAL